MMAFCLQFCRYAGIRSANLGFARTRIGFIRLLSSFDDEGAIREHSIVAPSSSKEESSRMNPILVRAKPKFADRIPAYLQNCRQNAIMMLDALDRVDFETVTILGHQMRGSGGAYGFQAITDIG